MNETLTKKFYDEVIDKPNFLMNAKSLTEILRDLPQYRASRLKRTFESSCPPFTKSESSGFRVIFSDDGAGEYDYLRVDVWCYESSSILAIWDRDYEQYKLSRISKVVSECAMGAHFVECPQHESKREISDSWIRPYRFPEDEKNLEDDLKDVFSNLNKWKLDRRSESASHSQTVDELVSQTLKREN